MPDGGASWEAALTADYNAEMIEQIERFPRLRDRAVFVGNPGDVVPDSFGADLPPIRDWAEQHYQFSGYISGYDPAEVADRAAIRAELGYRPDEKICLVTVGGSGVGADLLHRVVAAYPTAKRRGARAEDDRGDRGLRIATWPRCPHGTALSCMATSMTSTGSGRRADLAVVQGGLTTAMELDRGPARPSSTCCSHSLRAELPRPAPAPQIPRGPLPGISGHQTGIARPGHGGGDRPSRQ